MAPLPSFPDFEKNKKLNIPEESPAIKESKENLGSLGGLPRLELPDLDSLEDLQEISEEESDEKFLRDVYENSDNLEEPKLTEEELSREIEDFEKVETEEEAFDFEDKDEFNQVDESELEDEDDDGDFIIEDEDDEEPYYDEDEEESGLDKAFKETMEKLDEKKASLLPAIEDDYEDDDYEQIEEEEEVKPEKPVKKPKDKKSGKFKELDDESVKEFFMNLKDKFSRGKPGKQRNPKEKSRPSAPKMRAKRKLPLIPMISALVVILGIAVFMFIYNSGFHMISETTINIENEDLNLVFTDFKENNGNLEFTVKNEADISTDFIINVELQEQSLVPFLGNKILSISDIIALEPDMSSNQILSLEDFNKDSKYKIKFDIVQLP